MQTCPQNVQNTHERLSIAASTVFDAGRGDLLKVLGPKCLKKSGMSLPRGLCRDLLANHCTGVTIDHHRKDVADLNTTGTTPLNP